jgi:polyisoprenoid-binding protein YceI
MKNLLYITMAFVAVLAFSLAALPVYAAEFEVDPVHSQIEFKVTHMVIAKVRGNFETYTASFILDDKNRLVSLMADIEVKSLNTRVEKRDNDLRSENFFYAEKFPRLTFKSTSITPGAGGTYSVKGDITIRGVTKEITLTGGIVGPIIDPWGNTRMGFSAEGMINRKDFGLNWNKIIESGGLLVGDNVSIILEGEGILKK